MGTLKMRCLHCPCPPRRGSQMAVYCLHFSSPASLLFWEDYWVVCIIACSGADCSNRAEFQKAQTSGLTGQGKGTSSGGRRNNPGSWVDPCCHFTQGGITGPQSPKPLPTSAFQPPHLGRGRHQPGRSQLRKQFSPMGRANTY